MPKKKNIFVFLALAFSLFLLTAAAGRAAQVVYDPWLFTKEFIIKPLVRKVANSMENKLVNEINAKIAGVGAKSPLFVTNWRNLVLDSQGRGNDIFRAILADTNLCPYFAKNIKTIFGADAYNGASSFAKVRDAAGKVVYENELGIPGLPDFKTSNNCSLPSDFDPTVFRKDFAGGGGWATWNKLIENQNNFIGAFVAALDEQSIQTSIESTSTQNEAVAGGGFLSQKLGVANSGTGPTGCTVNQDAATGEVHSRCLFLGKIVTPGQVLGETAVNEIDTKIKRVGAAEELTDIVLSLFAAVLDNTTSKIANYIGQDSYSTPPKGVGSLPTSDIPTQDFQIGNTSDIPTQDIHCQGVCQAEKNNCLSRAPQVCGNQPPTNTQVCQPEPSATALCQQININCLSLCKNTQP